MARFYKYRGLSLADIQDDYLWAVVGCDRVLHTAGVLEWCNGEDDARERMNAMIDSGEFSTLSIRKWDTTKKDK